MEIKKGISVSPGVVIGTALVLDAEDLLIPKRFISPEQVPAEVQRLEGAIGAATVELGRLRDTITAEHGRDIGSIFDFHLALLHDKSLVGQFYAEINNHKTTAEYAVSVVMRRYSGTVSAIKDKYLSERVKDIHDIEKRVLRLLIGQKHEDLAHLTQNVVVIAHDLLPSQTAALDRKHVVGFATDVGGRTSHTAIVARAMGIPAVVGLGNITSEVSGGDTVIIDGTRGVVIVNPDLEQLEEHKEAGRKHDEVERQLRTLSNLPAQTLDGHEVSLMANIEFPEDITDAEIHGAQGIGLYRTEFLYLASEREPSEDEHYASYADALRRLKGKPLVIRTLDLGADKYTQAKALNPERNPFLGDRSIRMCLHDIPMFKRQLRAIMRASVLGDVRIMFPMICTLMELRQAKMVLNDVMEELEDEGIPFRRDIPTGMMVEVPSAALMADQFAKEVNFFSIGTNDLIQYTLAVDRTNEKVAGLFCPAHPSVLKLVRDVIRAGRRNSISVSICGEMAGDPLYTLLLLGLELNIFSMNAPDVPEVKKIIRSTTMEHARHVARRVMSFDSERQVMHFLREETRKIIPEAF
ncbi:MAG: Phosphoenolpyruvate-protein phosphotransferase of system [Phycisphaerales bacterium]|jgi:phosphoenolpyruvate-protein phosphotransferase (PTS system enzyme I)|nr:Phosphoenolpyruvate-protein phosphotransferase of system [Phycisphaerales bacterium]